MKREKMAFAKPAATDLCGNQLSIEQSGMTLREYYAGQALAGMIIRQNDQDLPYEGFPKVVALECVRLADALIAELEKEGNRG